MRYRVRPRPGTERGSERHGTGDRDMGGPVVLLIGGVWLLLCGVLVVGGLAAVVRGLRRRTAARRLLGAGVATRGVIVDNQLTSLSEGQVLFSPVVTFAGPDGAQVRTALEVRSSTSYVVGSGIDLTYDP